jgi:hypothetical protein
LNMKRNAQGFCGEEHWLKCHAPYEGSSSAANGVLGGGRGSAEGGQEKLWDCRRTKGGYKAKEKMVLKQKPSSKKRGEKPTSKKRGEKQSEQPAWRRVSTNATRPTWTGSLADEDISKLSERQLAQLQDKSRREKDAACLVGRSIMTRFRSGEEWFTGEVLEVAVRKVYGGCMVYHFDSARVPIKLFWRTFAVHASLSNFYVVVVFDLWD